MSPGFYFSEWAAWAEGAPFWLMLLAKGTLLLAAAWMLQMALSKANARWRVLLWRASMAGLVLLPFLSVWMPPLELELRAPARRAFTQKISGTALPPSANLGSPIPSAPSEPLNHRFEEVNWNRVAFAFWAVGAALAAARFAGAHLRLRRFLRECDEVPQSVAEQCRKIADQLGCVEKISMRAHPGIGSPFLAGLWRPAILLPEPMCANGPSQELAAVLAHELTHLKSRDVFWNQILWLLSMTLWFHPLVWRIRKAHDAASEEISDGAAAGWAGGARSYGRLLARIATGLAGARLPMPAYPMAGRAEIFRRLDALERLTGHAPLGLSRILTCLGIGSALLLGTASASLVVVRVVPRPPPDALGQARRELTAEEMDQMFAAELFARLGARGITHAEAREIERRLASAPSESLPELRRVLRREGPRVDFLRAAEARQSALRILAKMGREAKPAMPELIEALQGRTAHLSVLETQVLGGMGNDAREAIPALAQAFRAGNHSAGQAMIQINPADRAVWEAHAEKIREWRAAEFRASDAGGFVRTLARLENFTAESAGLIQGILEENRAFPEDMKPMGEQAAAYFWGTEIAAVETLGHLNTPEARPILQQALKHRSTHVRQKAAEMLLDNRMNRCAGPN